MYKDIFIIFVIMIVSRKVILWLKVILSYFLFVKNQHQTDQLLINRTRICVVYIMIGDSSVSWKNPVRFFARIHGAALLSVSKIRVSIKNILCLPQAQLSVTVAPGRWFQSLTDILSISGSGQILTWFRILTAIHARPPSIPYDASCLSGATFPPRWVSPSSWSDVMNFSLLKRTHLTDDGVTVNSRHDTHSCIKSYTRHVPTHLKL